MSLSNTAGESALVYPRDLWFSPGAHRDVRNSAVPLMGVGGPAGSSAPRFDGPPQGSPSAFPGPSPPPPPHATERDAWEEEPRVPGCTGGDGEEPMQGTGLGRGYAALKAKVSKFGSGLWY